MTRQNATNYVAPSPQFPYANAGGDPFLKEDVQVLALAVDQHDHSNTRGLAVTRLASGAAASNVGTLGGALSGTLPNPTLAANSVGASQITDGTVGSAELANAAVTNAKLASDTARQNLLTNGGFEIWQRGNGPFTAGASFNADRWQGNYSAGGLSVTAQASIVVDGGTAMQAAYTHAGGFGQIYQVIDPKLVLQLRGKTITASISLLPGVAAGTAYVSLSGNTSGSVNGNVVTNTGGYLRSTVTLTVATNETTLSFSAILSGATCSFYLDAAMLVVGNVAADYAPLHPADDLARCLRYYEFQSPEVSGYLAAGGQALVASIPFRAPKPVTPSLTVAGSWTPNNCSATPAVGIRPGSLDTFYWYVVSTAAGMASIYPSGSPAGRVALEANP